MDFHLYLIGISIEFQFDFTWISIKILLTFSLDFQWISIAFHWNCYWFSTWFHMFRCTVNRTCQCFVWKKLISQPRVVEKSPFLAWRTLTHYILISVIFRPHLTPPICLKMTKCAIFGLFWSFHFKDTPKVGVHREKI